MLPTRPSHRMAWSVLLIAHTFGAMLALILGPVNLLRKPRGDPFHKSLGYTWAALMDWVAISSFWIRDINNGQFSPIHLLSVLTLVTLTLGIVFAIRRKMRAHRGMMQGTYIGLVGAFIGAVIPPCARSQNWCETIPDPHSCGLDSSSLPRLW